MLTLTGIRKAFGGRRVLDGLDLHIDSGESVALVGANGSGKTTTLRCIVGLATPDAGTIEIAGRDARRDPIGARKSISYLPQKSSFPSTLTVRETLDVVARLRGVGEDAVGRELNACGLARLASEGVGHLSGGERQRLAMAVAFLPSADLYLFDEPSANLDPVASRILFDRARALARNGHTLLFTTHVPADVRHLATRVVLLRNGRVESDGSGEFEVRRFEHMLEREMWGNHHETPTDDDCGGRGDSDDCVRRPDALAGAGSARSR